jgi:glutathione S-transferase
MTVATLTINSRNYGAWSLRGWLLCTFAGIDFELELLRPDDPASRAELLLLSPSFVVPSLRDGDVNVWDTIAMAEYLHEIHPEAGLLPADPVARARCRSISGEMHAGFAHLRAAMPMNLRARHERFKVWSGAQIDIDRVVVIWEECLAISGGPFLFGATPTAADAMYAPVCTRFDTYGVELDGASRAYCDLILGLPAMQEWRTAALAEPEELDELDAEF